MQVTGEFSMDGPKLIPSRASVHPDGMEIWVRDDSALLVGFVLGLPLVMFGLLLFAGFAVLLLDRPGILLVVLVLSLVAAFFVCLLSVLVGLWWYPMFSQLRIRGNQATTVGWFFGLLYKRRTYPLTAARLLATFNPDSSAGRLSFECQDGRSFSCLLNRSPQGLAHVRWARFHLEQHLALLASGEAVSSHDQDALKHLSTKRVTEG